MARMWEWPRNIYVPAMMQPVVLPVEVAGGNILEQDGANWLFVFGRLKPGVTCRDGAGGNDGEIASVLQVEGGPAIDERHCGRCADL